MDKCERCGGCKYFAELFFPYRDGIRDFVCERDPSGKLFYLGSDERAADGVCDHFDAGKPERYVVDDLGNGTPWDDEKPEAVDHPAHYNHPGQRECIVAMEEDYGPYVTMIFCLANAFKYIYRAGDKPGIDRNEDLRKARWYVNYAEEIIADGKAGLGRGRDWGFYYDVRDMLKEVENERA